MINSTIHPNAKIGKNANIGPYCFIAENVEIGDNCQIGPNVVIYDYVKIGNNCRIFPGAVVGAIPQDLKFAGEITYVEIGDNTTIRECATINRGTKASGKGLTKIGNNCLIMSYVHIAHDCDIKDHVILTSYVGLAGEIEIDEYAIIGGNSAAHQFTKIGTHAMLGGGSLLSQDVPPYILAANRPVTYQGVNIVGLKRRGYTVEQISMIKEIYGVIYQSGLNRSDACKRVEEVFPDTPEKRNILEFIKSSQRGIIRYNSRQANIDE